MKYYKFLTADNRGEYSRFDFTDYLPKDGKSGKWLPKTSNPVICEQGYHCFKPEHILEWLNTQLFEVEIRGKTIEGDTKIAAQQMRFVRKLDAWNDSSARLFAEGKTTKDQLAAAWDAAGAAAWAAAWAKYTDHLLEFLGISDED